MSAALWILPLGLIICAVASLVLPHRSSVGLRRFAIVFLAAALTTQIARIWHGFDPLSGWYFVTVAVLSIFALWYSGPYIAREAQQHQWSTRRCQSYDALLFVFIASLLAIALWTNLLWLWVAMEAATFSSVVLAALPNTTASIEAAWKYVIVTETGAMFALLGTVLALTAVGSPLFAWHALPAHLLLTTARQHWALIGAYFALVGYGAKAGLAPFHTWLPDAHSEAPAPVSGLLSAIKLAGAVVIVYRLFRILTPVVPALYLQDALIGLGLLSLLIAASSLAFQRDLKRFWAYSSIEHIGIISLGVGFGGIALIGAALHIWTHAISKTLLFHNAGTVRLLYHTSDSQYGARAILHRTPWTGALLALGSAAIVGLPPFAPFWSEWLVLAGGFHQVGDRVFVAIAAALLVVIFVAIARRVPTWLFSAGPVGMPPSAPAISEPVALILPSVALAVLVVIGGIALPLVAHPLWQHLVHQLGSVYL
ncbi:MAG: nitroreductase family protein [Sulfobacillus acidophilus]|uniref:Nitroreductase family protein n=1 Tax=Sulfobacillus acidophilus TaxID=53633 RepID=A0A2T2WMP6_9FIRM|nr:MAG: nitroreductase family protein [Sulfobacillus acidophilus]